MSGEDNLLEKPKKLQKLDEQESDSSAETCHSWQERETIFVQDSGDLWSPSSDENEQNQSMYEDENNPGYAVEYEPVLSNHSSNILDTEGSSDVDEVFLPVEMSIEESSSRYETPDNEVTSHLKTERLLLNTKWSCVRCKKTTNLPMRYCQECYQAYKSGLTPRPKRTRKGKALSKKGEKSSSKHSEISVDSNQETVMPGFSGSQQAGVKQFSDLCGLCIDRVACGAFIHGNTAHQMYCYGCSKRIWRERKVCPACRRTIVKVVKIFQAIHS